MIIKLNEPLKFKLKQSIELEISDIIKEKIDVYWKEFIKNKKDYWDGDIFVVTNVDSNDNIMEISKTKFSSLVYSKMNKDLIIRPLFTSILLKTKDNKYIITKNNHNNINLIGGLADNQDFKDGNFIPYFCVHREVLEEIGIDLNNNSQVLYYNMKFLKVPTNDENYYPIGILYTGKLNFTSEDFEKYISNNNFDGEIKNCYFYSTEECLNLNLKKTDVSYLKEFISIENKDVGL